MAGSQPRQALTGLKPTPSGDALYRVLGHSARVLYHCLMGLKIEGIEKLPRDRGYLVVSNHLSEVDPITIAYPVFLTGTLPRFLAKESLFRAPVIGWILRKLAHIPVARGSIDARKSLETAQNVLESGGAVVIYPEGTLSEDPQGWMIAARTGAARLAFATGVPVYPIAHWGDQEFLSPTGKFRPFPRKKVQVKIGDPIDFSDLQGSSPAAAPTREDLTTATERMVSAITALLEDIRGEKEPEGRWNPITRRRELPGEKH
ncbi:lysophospholipid acyltransferase family protein [Rothia sp. CCM 9418]|uniref:lysophospholipid acyltransferase family protein n=1 Tax=Rothia sp. CCM 9418 TaxID=3402661 RepID=UPI003AE631DB